jgi:hypothetical protein
MDNIRISYTKYMIFKLNLKKTYLEKSEMDSQIILMNIKDSKYFVELLTGYDFDGVKFSENDNLHKGGVGSLNQNFEGEEWKEYVRSDDGKWTLEKTEPPNLHGGEAYIEDEGGIVFVTVNLTSVGVVAGYPDKNTSKIIFDLKYLEWKRTGGVFR